MASHGFKVEDFAHQPPKAEAVGPEVFEDLHSVHVFGAAVGIPQPKKTIWVVGQNRFQNLRGQKWGWLPYYHSTVVFLEGFLGVHRGTGVLTQYDVQLKPQALEAST